MPTAPGVGRHDIFTRFLNGDGSIDAVATGTGAPVIFDNPGPSDVVGYP